MRCRTVKAIHDQIAYWNLVAYGYEPEQDSEPLCKRFSAGCYRFEPKMELCPMISAPFSKDYRNGKGSNPIVRLRRARVDYYRIDGWYKLWRFTFADEIEYFIDHLIALLPGEVRKQYE